MGCFESIYATCASCGTRLEFQSKAGPCTMGEYNIKDPELPPVIAGDLDGESQSCSCGKTISIKTVFIIIATTE